jgi:hypothetical protein
MKRNLIILAVLAIAALFVGFADNTSAFSFIVRNRLVNYGSTFGGTSIAKTGTAGTMTFVNTYGTTFTVSGTTKQDSIVPEDGRMIRIITSSTDTLVDGKNLKLAGNFTGTADDMIVLYCSGTVWYEQSRSAN